MIQFRDTSAPKPSPAIPAWPGRQAFLAAPHVRINGGDPIAWATFVSANAIGEEDRAEIWTHLVACGVTRICDGPEVEVVLTGCGRPGSVGAVESDAFADAEDAAQRTAETLSRDTRSIRLCDLLSADSRTAGLGPVTVIIGGIVLKTTSDGRGLYGCRRAGGAR